MVAGNLNTTNVLLGIMAVVSVLQLLLLLIGGYKALKLYSRAMQTVTEIERRQVAPLVSRVNLLMGSVDEILGDVKGITSRVGHQTARVSSAIVRADETADRVKTSLAYPAQRVMALVHGVRAAFGTLVNGYRRTATHP